VGELLRLVPGGVGRYLYSLPKQWVDYDPQKKRLTGTPQLPAWAVPKPLPKAPNGTPAKAPEPKSGAELSRSLDQLDDYLTEHGYCPRGHLRAEVLRLSGEAKPVEEWSVATVNAVVQLGKALAAKLRQPDTALARQRQAALDGQPATATT
jgi:hypothetical protein